MRASRVRQRTIGLQLAAWESTLFIGQSASLQLTSYAPKLPEHREGAKLRSIRTARLRAPRRAVLRLPLPANDNLAPLG